MMDMDYLFQEQNIQVIIYIWSACKRAIQHFALRRFLFYYRKVSRVVASPLKYLKYIEFFVIPQLCAKMFLFCKTIARYLVGLKLRNSLYNARRRNTEEWTSLNLTIKKKKNSRFIPREYKISGCAHFFLFITFHYTVHTFGIVYFFISVYKRPWRRRIYIKLLVKSIDLAWLYFKWSSCDATVSQTFFKS